MSPTTTHTGRLKRGAAPSPAAAETKPDPAPGVSFEDAAETRPPTAVSRKFT